VDSRSCVRSNLSSREDLAMAGPKMAVLVLSEAERSELMLLSARRKTGQALALRARIVLECARGLENREVAAHLRLAKGTVGKWRRRFVEHRLDGLRDDPRSGAPRTIEDADIEAVIVKTLESMPENATHWSSRGMAKASGISVSSVQRIWRAFGLQPHRIETFKLSTDPDFVVKVRDVVGLYVSPPEHAVVLCVDVHLVWDNYATHKTPLIRNWLAKRPRWHVHLTPTSASWLNQVERFFALITERKIRRGIYRSVTALRADIASFIDKHNNDPKPFRWTKSADDILKSIERFCLYNAPAAV